tara:strand:+ start:422 stop:565 length:144 start_codon:yes stop_codon:yes gene_type:complete
MVVDAIIVSPEDDAISMASYGHVLTIAAVLMCTVTLNQTCTNEVHLK